MSFSVGWLCISALGIPSESRAGNRIYLGRVGLHEYHQLG